MYKYDSTLFEICDRKDVSVIQESVDIAARSTKQNDMNINSEKSKEISTSFAQVLVFQKHYPEYKDCTSLPCQSVRCDHFSGSDVD